MCDTKLYLFFFVMTALHLRFSLGGSHSRLSRARTGPASWFRHGTAPRCPAMYREFKMMTTAFLASVPSKRQ